jgi:hypothetical protein
MKELHFEGRADYAGEEGGDLGRIYSWLNAIDDIAAIRCFPRHLALKCPQ